MCIITIFILFKTLFFLRIFPNYTPIVMMLVHVVYDLRQFLFVYSILLFMLTLLFSVMGLGSYLNQLENDLENEGWHRLLEAGGSKVSKSIENGLAGIEYIYIKLFMGQLAWTFRLSTGDTGCIDASVHLD
jgi:hypothetical protein